MALLPDPQVPIYHLLVVLPICYNNTSIVNYFMFLNNWYTFASPLNHHLFYLLYLLHFHYTASLISCCYFFSFTCPLEIMVSVWTVFEQFFVRSFYLIVSQEILYAFFHGLQTSASPPFFSASFAFCTSLFPFYSRITCTMSQSAAHLSMLQTGSPSVRCLFNWCFRNGLGKLSEAGLLTHLMFWKRDSEVKYYPCKLPPVFL